ncbi:hypothetical protein BpHYR1_020510, partial [Brachionus plicatilis]
FSQNLLKVSMNKIQNTRSFKYLELCKKIWFTKKKTVIFRDEGSWSAVNWGLGPIRIYALLHVLKHIVDNIVAFCVRFVQIF